MEQELLWDLCQEQRDPGVELTVTLSKSLEKIEESAFEHANITSLVLPDSLKVIEYRAFRRCYLLKDLTIGDGSQLESIGAEVFGDLETENEPITYSVNP